jgi:enoyl-CoA hydratase
MNALNPKLMQELGAAMAGFDADDGIGAILVTGNEKAFAAGADIGAMKDFDFQHAFRTDYITRDWEHIRNVRKPVIAAVAGYALGGGSELTMMCDLAIAAENARFGQPEINLGIMPGAGGTQRLTRAAGKARAMEIILTGRHVPATEAYAMGLVTRVVPDELVLAEAKNLAQVIASKPPVAVRLAKESILKAFDTTLETGLDYERTAFYLLFSTEDKNEGIAAFLEKRPPTFKGR